MDKEYLDIKSSIILLILAILSNSVFAECKKEDITYYLDKGFTHEQITKLCSDELSSKSSNSSSYTSFKDEYIDKTDLEYLKRMRIERQVFLRSSINAQNIQLNRDELSYNGRECAREGLSRDEEANTTGCAIVRTTIKLSTVEVSNDARRERVFFGAYMIEITGEITHEIIGGFEGLPKYDRDVLAVKVEDRLSRNQNKAKIPLKRGLDFNYALESFRDIVNFEKAQKNKINLDNESLGGEIDDSDLTISKDSNYIIENDEKNLRFSDEDVKEEIVFDDLGETQDGEKRSGSTEIPDSVFD